MLDLIGKADRIVAFTGAGVSTLCGVPDFRGPQGLYRQKDAERIFDIDWFERDPSIYYRGCRELVYGLKDVKPGPVHCALKKLEDDGRLIGVITQNIDMLHQKAGSSNVWEIHGTPAVHHCRRCGAARTFAEICAMIEAGEKSLEAAGRAGETFVPRCGCGGVFKPDITFFGEALPEAAFMSAREAALEADLMLVLGTSLTVYPAAGLPELALRRGGKVAIVNGQPTMLDDHAAAIGRDLAEFASAVLG